MPDCDDELKPKIGQVFDILNNVENFTKNMHTMLDLVCIHHQKLKIKTAWSVGSTLFAQKKLICKWRQMKRSRVNLVSRMSLARKGCNANVIFKRVEEGKYELVRFHENHT